MPTPPFLNTGDTVAIVSTARYPESEALYLAECLLSSWGLNVVFGKTTSLRSNRFAGTDAQRAEDFQTMINDPNIKAIWCARGGYGTVRIIDNIDFSEFVKTPKWIVGFSDVTVLHAMLSTLGVPSLHAPMPATLAQNTPEALESLRKALFGEPLAYQIPYVDNRHTSPIFGSIVGGNLSVLYSLLGSKTSVQTKDKILFIEDLGEYLYHIDRMLVNLKRNGYFIGLKALLVGDLRPAEDNDVPFAKSVKEVIREHTSSYNFPVIFDVLSGHIPNNMALYFGKPAKLTFSTQTLLEL